MATLVKAEFEKFGPYRFIGKSVYARCGPHNSGCIFGSLWGNFGHIFETLDKMPDYVTDEKDNIALITMDKYDEPKQLMGYTIGKFMKPDTPVPDGLDFFDIPEMFVIKSLIKGEFFDMICSNSPLTNEAIKQQSKYVTNCSGFFFEAEVYTSDTKCEDGKTSTMKYYISCKEKE